jgi:hypothetical protein
VEDLDGDEVEDLDGDDDETRMRMRITLCADSRGRSSLRPPVPTLPPLSKRTPHRRRGTFVSRLAACRFQTDYPTASHETVTDLHHRHMRHWGNSLSSLAGIDLKDVARDLELSGHARRAG